MVTVRSSKHRQDLPRSVIGKFSISMETCLFFLLATCITTMLVSLLLIDFQTSPDSNQKSVKSHDNVIASNREKLATAITSKQQQQQQQCITSISNLSPSERFPKKGQRHMVQPPAGPIILVCCQSTAGPLTIAVHPTWAPLGAERFLSMVSHGWFSSKVPLFRCIPDFLCQFGIPGQPELLDLFAGSIKDDVNWLPEGPSGRVNEDGVVRFAKGYMSYAGYGKDSRTYQLVIANNYNRFLGGGSPWEVPFGELVGESSFETLDRIYMGYGENGPKQMRLFREGVTPALEKEFPRMDYITSCKIVEKEEGESSAE